MFSCAQRMTHLASQTSPHASQSGNPGIRGLGEYAGACRQAGQRLILCGTSWWREVRPCFFRPLLPFVDVPSGATGLPWRALLGGSQYAVSQADPRANSWLSYLAFERAQGYNIHCLNPRLRSYVRAAEKRFVIKPLGRGEFKELAHPIYVEFYERTGYGYLAKRVNRIHFEGWADAEFSDGGLVGLGAWEAGSLVAASLSRVVGEAWVYSSFFATNNAIRGQVANLMLHHARCLAAAVDGVSMVYVGMRKSGEARSVDAFYMHRGALPVRRPAILTVNPLVEWTMRRFRPSLWQHIEGHAEAQGASADAGRPEASVQKTR